MSHGKEIVRFGILGLALLCLGGQAAFAQCTVSRSQVLADLEAGDSGEELQAKYEGCVSSDPSGESAPSLFVQEESRVGQKVDAANSPAFSGNTFYERIQSCGYHPQREEAVCSIEIRQNGGFGGRICAAQGSTEYVLLCVNLGAGLVPIHTGTVHVHDAPGAAAPWDFGVVIQANPALASRANNGATLPARAILSWAIPPANCNAVPIWGNAVNFRLRLDP